MLDLEGGAHRCQATGDWDLVMGHWARRRNGKMLVTSSKSQLSTSSFAFSPTGRLIPNIAGGGGAFLGSPDQKYIETYVRPPSYAKNREVM